MNRYPKHILAVAFVSIGLLVAAPARAATLTQVSPTSTWSGGVTVPSYVQMWIYVPSPVAAKPPIVVSAHSCGSTASGQMGNITHFQAAADKNGFILILPDNPGQNCWDVGSSQALKHDGGSDTQAVAQMVKYALTKYNGDASRVYIFGGSSGGILTQGMLGVYPDIFRAGSARAGVPAGCWGVQYDQGGTRQWSTPCANGQVTHTAKEWGDMVRAMYPGYTGHRPRVQLIQGGADTTIASANMPESIKEWTNVLGLSETPTSTDKGYKGQVSSYDRQFWQNACGFTVLESWVAPGQNHSMGYEEDAMLKFFGLDTATTSDPEPDCSGDGGVAGTGGMSGSGGTTGAGGAKDGGPSAKDGGNDVAAPGSGGVQGSGGSSGSGGMQGSGGSAKGGAEGGGGTVGHGGGSGSGGTSAKGGTSGSGGTSASGGSLGSGGSSAKGGSGGESSGGTQGIGGSSARGGNSGTGGSTSGGSTSSGCSIAVGSHAERSGSHFAVLLLAALGLIFRRRRRTPR